MKDVKTNYKATITKYNNICTNLPKVTKVTDSRKRAIRRIHERFSDDEIEMGFRKAQASEFLSGKFKGQGHENWICTFDWIMKDTNMAKVLDGNYDNRGKDTTPDPKQMDNSKTKMVMTYEFISPEMAGELLEKNTNNRSLSWGTIRQYANDIKSGNWDSGVGSAISIDEKGMLRDGQHRLWAIVESDCGIWTWVCRGVSCNGIYDNNRKRSLIDQGNIIAPELEDIFKSKRYIAMARWLIGFIDHGNHRRAISPNEILDFTAEHKNDLNRFFENVPITTHCRSISVASVHIAIFSAYMAGINADDLKHFYEVLCSGMSTCAEEFPIISFRNYMINKGADITRSEDIMRCQYAIKGYIAKSCAKKLYRPKDFIYPIPYKDGQQALDIKTIMI